MDPFTEGKVRVLCPICEATVTIYGNHYHECRDFRIYYNPDMPAVSVWKRNPLGRFALVVRLPVESDEDTVIHIPAEVKDYPHGYPEGGVS